MAQRQEVTERLENCISDIQSWMVTTKQQQNRVTCISIILFQQTLSTSN